MVTTEPLVHLEHPEIHHYTNADGLRGIWTSGELWATHFLRLNDTSEVIHAKELLIESVSERLIPHAIIKSKTDKKLATALSQIGTNVLVSHDVRKFIEALYEITYDTGGKAGIPFANPFVVSFCSHTADNEYIQKNGLLSQWRGYGGDGAARYAIVFDTEKLSNLLEDDAKHYDHTSFFMLDVIYNSGLANFRARFNDEIRVIFNAVRDATFAPDFPTLKEVYPSFVRTTTRFKHRAFAEEREIRIVYSPALAEMRTFLEEHGAPEATAPLRTIFANGSGADCVHLLEASQGARQAITRVIVGPSTDMHLAAKTARELVGDCVPVHISDTPFIKW